MSSTVAPTATLAATIAAVPCSTIVAMGISLIFTGKSGSQWTRWWREKDSNPALGGPPKPNTSRLAPQHRIYPYSLRGVAIDRPNQVWAVDITYIPMARANLIVRPTAPGSGDQENRFDAN
jgi:transposase InsO family protein